MNILIVCQYFYPERFRVNDICFELVKRGYNVTVLTGLPNYPEGSILEDYKKVRYEEINGVKVYRSWLIGRGNSRKSLFLNYISFAISSILRTYNINKDFDKILVYQLSPVTMALPGIVLKKRFKKPLIIYTHDLWPESISSGGVNQNSIIYKTVRKLSKYIYKSADEIWYSSEMFDKYFKEYLGVDIKNRYLPSFAEKIFDNIGIQGHKNVINLVFAGNIGEMQSVETIVEVANILRHEKKVKFHIVGDGSSKKKCENLAKSFDLDNIVFYGSKPLEEMPYFYNLADAFIMTLKDNEVISYTLPNKVQSYLAAGKPILASVYGETKRIIEKSNSGLVSYPTDAAAFANNILAFSKLSSDERLTLGINARNYYDNHFSRESYFKSLESFLK